MNKNILKRIGIGAALVGAGAAIGAWVEHWRNGYKVTAAEAKAKNAEDDYTEDEDEDDDDLEIDLSWCDEKPDAPGGEDDSEDEDDEEDDILPVELAARWAAYWSAHRWIRVKDALPEEHKVVLVHYTNGKFFTDFLYWRRFGETTWNKVTHWVPLPDAPSGAANDPWISVDEYFPKLKTQVLVYHTNGEIKVERYCIATDKWTLEDIFGDIYGKVTHWMPIPRVVDTPDGDDGGDENDDGDDHTEGGSSSRKAEEVNTKVPEANTEGEHLSEDPIVRNFRTIASDGKPEPAEGESEGENVNTEAPATDAEATEDTGHGRPTGKKNHQGSKPKISAYFDNSEWAELSRLVEKSGCSKSDFFRFALQNFKYPFKSYTSFANGTKRKNHVTVDLTVAEKKKLDLNAAKAKISQSEFLRRAVFSTDVAQLLT